VITPSWNQGFARSQGESANPGLWRGLVAAWVPLLGHTGGAAFDLGPEGFHGSLTSLPLSSSWVISQANTALGYAVNFNGSGYVLTTKLGDFGSVFTNLRSSFVFWLRCTTSSVAAVAGTLNTGSSLYLQFLVNANHLAALSAGKIFVGVRDAADNSLFGAPTSSISINDSNWHHIAVRFDCPGTTISFFP
jgi:hypothetical protein